VRLERLNGRPLIIGHKAAACAADQEGRTGSAGAPV
jgi:hypothetical protein